MNWCETTLNEIVDFFDHKRVPLNSRQRAERKGQYPYYGAQSIIDWVDNYLFDGRYLLVPEDGENLNSRKLPIAFFANGRFWVNNHAHIVRAKKNIADDIFLKNWLNNADISGYITGAAQPKLSQANMRRITILLPPLPIQRRIASILSAYDDLIENNTRRIAILEEMARRIYEEWFVKFKFPGHEKVKMVDSELGKIPEGWKVKHFNEVYDVKYGKGLPTKNLLENGKYPVYGAGGIIGYYDDFVSKCKIALITCRGNGSGTVWRTREAAFITNNSFLIFARNSNIFEYFFVELHCYYSNLKRALSGSAQPQITIDGLSQLTVLLPPDDLIQRFVDMTRSIPEQIDCLHKKNSNLRTTRDFLLPKLISGEIDVSKLPKPEEIAA